MVRRQLRSTSIAKHKTRVPGNRSVIHYSRRKPSAAHCQYCGAKLNGVPRDRPGKARKVHHSSRRPERPYGGNLCPRCLAQSIRKAVQK